MSAPPRSVTLRLVGEGTAAVSVCGRLDATAVHQIDEAVVQAQEGPVRRVVLDLSQVSTFTSDAPAALHRSCRRMTWLPHGVGMQADSAAGRAALLAMLLAAPEGTHADLDGPDGENMAPCL